MLRSTIAKLRFAPEDPVLRGRLRVIAAELGSWDELAALLAQEARATADRRAALVFYEELARVQEDLDRDMDAIESIEAMLALEPDHEPYLERLGTLYRRTNQLDRAIATYRTLVARRPHDAEARAILDQLETEKLPLPHDADDDTTIGALLDRIEVLSRPELDSESIEDPARLVQLAMSYVRAGRTHEVVHLLLANASERLSPRLVAGWLDIAAMLDDIDANAARQIRERVQAPLLDARAGHPSSSSSPSCQSPSDTVPPKKRAQQLHREALAKGAHGEHDEAHRLLNEAHALDRQSLSIRLALGESCFERQLWREAAIYLGVLADHPDAGKHAHAVALALVRAGQAETRGSRAEHAEQHYEAAVRIDPSCGPAWHALGQLARERQDWRTAITCCDKEAAATSDPAARVRHLEAAADLAQDKLGDLDLAERYLVRTVEHAPIAVLEKLVALQRRHAASVEQGATCMRLAGLLQGAARRPYIEEGVTSFMAAGKAEGGAAALRALVAQSPHDLDTVACASAIVNAAGYPAVAAEWLKRALDAPVGARGASDPVRAEAWALLGDAEQALGNSAAARTAYEHALIDNSVGPAALRARRGLLQLSDARRTVPALAAIVEVEQRPEDVLAWARALAQDDQHDRARLAYELASLLGASLSDDDEHVLARPSNPISPDEAYGTVLDERELRALLDDPEPHPLEAVFAALGEAAAFVCPAPKAALEQACLGDAKPVGPTTAHPAVAIYAQIAKAFGGPPTLLHVLDGTCLRDPWLELASPPLVVFGRESASLHEATLRFEIGRLVELARPHRIFAAGQDRAKLATWVAALEHALCSASDAESAEVAALAERLRDAIPIDSRKRIAEQLASIKRPLDLEGYLARCERAACRAGFLASGRLSPAIARLGDLDADLVKLAVSPRYLAVRDRLRPVRAR